jgi:hypothetical protein
MVELDYFNFVVVISALRMVVLDPDPQREIYKGPRLALRRLPIVSSTRLPRTAHLLVSKISF